MYIKLNRAFSDWYDSLPGGEPTYQETFEAGQANMREKADRHDREVAACTLNISALELENGELRVTAERNRVELLALWKALNDLSFECDGVTSTCPPTRATYNRTFEVMERYRLADVLRRQEHSRKAAGDNIAIDLFADAMKAKMLKQTLKGYSGWQTASPEVLKQALVDHIPKGDMVDVANFAMMVWSQQGVEAIEPHSWSSPLTDAQIGEIYAKHQITFCVPDDCDRHPATWIDTDKLNQLIRAVENAHGIQAFGETV